MRPGKTPGIRYLRRGAGEAADQLGGTISRRLSRGETVCWFLSGGSAIEVAVLTAARIGRASSKLTISLADERYGPVGHHDSNWTQLLQAGFSLPGARLEPILGGGDEIETAAGFNKSARRLLESSAYKIALLGIGADGHTAGILPGSPAAISRELTSDYTGQDYHRLTLTARALSLLDEAVVYAPGEIKATAINNLAEDLSLSEQPAQILKRIPKVTVYNGSKGAQSENSG